MYMYLVRHGEALSEEEDPGRGLSAKGQEHITGIGAFTKGLNIRVKHVYHSGKKRAMQTARIFAEGIESDMGVTETDGLLPMDAPEIWLERLSRMNESVMLVGHLPHLARLSSLMLCGGLETGALEFGAGSIACLKRSESDKWSVVWMMNAGLIR